MKPLSQNKSGGQKPLAGSRFGELLKNGYFSLIAINRKSAKTVDYAVSARYYRNYNLFCCYDDSRI
ncbi:MAG TPA: hypothetical protein DCF63_10665 [Planctomycetaceae bacterium]|nr:hypothetical protein [Planctomycetaceae bacterium]